MVNRGISEFPKNCLINTSIEASCKEKKKKKSRWPNEYHHQYF